MTDDVSSKSWTTERSTACLFAFGAIALVVLAFIYGRSGGLWSHLADAASVVTLYAAGWAIIFFLKSSKDGKNTLDVLTKRVAEVGTSLADLAWTVSADPKSLADMNIDAEDEPEPSGVAPIRQATVDAIEIEELPKGALPVRVLADLVLHWREEDHHGKWFLGSLDRVARRAGAGRGNHPWFVRFTEDDPGCWWRISYGGQGKRELGTVSYIGPPAPDRPS